MKKRFLAALAISALMLSACGGSNDSSSSSGDSSGSATGLTTSDTSSTSNTSSTSGHTHSFAFQSFEWTTTAGNYTAKAVCKCAADGEIEKHDATMTHTTEGASCEVPGVNHWKAAYDGHEDTKDEILPALGHDWSTEPLWAFNGMNYDESATATFVCLRDPVHTTSVTTTTVSVAENVPATCTVDGHRRLTATVTFNGQNYNGEYIQVFPANDHDPDVHGFCTVCDEYTGTEIDNPGTDYAPGKLWSGESYYYRFTFDEHYQYKLVSGIDYEDFHFYGLRSETWESITIKKSQFSAIEDTDDGYIYVAIVCSATYENQTFRFVSECPHASVDEYGFCNHCGEYAGITIAFSNFDNFVNMPATPELGSAYVRVDITGSEHISLVSDSVPFSQAFPYEKYYLKQANGYLEIETTEFIGFDNSEVENRTDPKFFFSADGRDNDGYLYCVFETDDGVAEGEYQLKASAKHSKANSQYGFCIACGEYVGIEFAIGVEVDQVNWSGKKGFYRAPYVGPTRMKVSLTNIPGSQIDVYYKNGENFQTVNIGTINFTDVPASSDGYLYVVITPSTLNGRMTFIEEA